MCSSAACATPPPSRRRRTSWRTAARSASSRAANAGGVNLFGESQGSGPLRPCIEDQLGAGAVVTALLRLGRAASAEAALAAAAYQATDVAAALRNCSSGRELAATGHENDVTLAAPVDVSETAPVLVDGILEGR